MIKPFKALAIVTVVTLTGCATLDQINKDVRNATAARTVTAEPAKDGLPKICQAAKENRVRANDYYVKKSLSVTGEVRSVNEGFKPRYRIYLLSGDISIHAETESPTAAKQVTVGKNTKIFGTITDVAYDFQGCSISIAF